MNPIRYKRDFSALTDEQLKEILERDWVQNNQPYFQNILNEELRRAGIGDIKVKFYTPIKPSLGLVDFYGVVGKLEGLIIMLYDPNSPYISWFNPASTRRKIRHEVAHIANGDLDERSGLVGFIKNILSEPRAILYANVTYRLRPS